MEIFNTSNIGGLVCGCLGDCFVCFQRKRTGNELVGGGLLFLLTCRCVGWFLCCFSFSVDCMIVFFVSCMCFLWIYNLFVLLFMNCGPLK